MGCYGFKTNYAGAYSNFALGRDRRP